MGFAPCKAEQPLQGMELQEKVAQKRLQHTGKKFKKVQGNKLLTYQNNEQTYLEKKEVEPVDWASSEEHLPK